MANSSERLHITSSISKQNRDKDETDTEFNDGNNMCGYRNCTPGWLQSCNNAKVFLICISWFTLIQGFVVNGINNVNTTSVERRFDLPSSKVGLISSAYDFSAGSTVILISYFGTHGHKPKWLSIGAFIMACGSLTMALPHFTTGNYQYDSGTKENMCSQEGNTTNCGDVQESTLQKYLYVLILGQLLHGIGGTTLYTLGTVFIDENVKTRSSPIYIGIMNANAALGPAIGYIVGGIFLSIYVDWDQMATPEELTEHDPRWVGAWWIGFLVASILALTVTIIMCGFPRELPSAKAVRADRVSQTHHGNEKSVVSHPGFGQSIKDMPASTLVLLKNPTFMLITLAGCFEGLAISGFATFLPKFIQNQFGQTASFSAQLTGFMAVPGAAGGQLVGGFLCKKWNLKVKGMLTISMISGGLSLLLASAFWIRCDFKPPIGLTEPYNNRTESLGSLQATCNMNCSCTTQSYDAICARDNTTGETFQYFSPCFAGCQNYQSDTEIYSNCSCIENINLEVRAGGCEKSCSLIGLFLPFLFFIMFFAFTSATPALSATLRCVPDKQRAFSLGLQWCFIRFLGTVPGPIICGALLDSTCLLWQDKCDEEGSCWTYDNALMSQRMFIVACSIKVSSLFLFTMAKLTYKAPPVKAIIATEENETE